MKNREKTSRIYCLVILALAWVGITSLAEGKLITFFTPTGAQIGGNPVNAKATLTTTTGKVTLLLENLVVNPTSVGQNLSGFYFTMSTGQTAGTLGASSGLLREIAAKGAYEDKGQSETGWLLSTSGSQLHLNVLGTSVGPAHTIVGSPDSSNKYGSAGGAIAGNGPHNPFIAERATFEINVPGISEASGISAVKFSFNTTSPAGVDIPGVPEPATLAFLILGSFGFLGLLRKRNR